MKRLAPALCLLALAGCAAPAPTTPAAPNTATSVPAPTVTPQLTLVSNASPSRSRTWPQCPDIWKDGQVLPADYVGCELDGELIVGETRTCHDGKGGLVNFGKHAWARMGGKIHVVKGDVAADPGFGESYESCTDY